MLRRSAFTVYPAAMRITIDRRAAFVPAQIALRPGDMIGLRSGMGQRILVQEGEIWITQEDDRKDHLLSPGARFEVTRDGLTLIQACLPSLVTLCPRARSSGPAD